MDTLTALLTRTSQGALTEPAPSADVLNTAFQAALRRQTIGYYVRGVI